MWNQNGHFAKRILKDIILISGLQKSVQFQVGGDIVLVPEHYFVPVCIHWYEIDVQVLKEQM